MKLKWLVMCACALLAVGGVGGAGGAAESDELDSLDDDDLALHEEESRNVHPRAYQQAAAAAYNQLPSGFRPAQGGGGGGGGGGGERGLAELAGYSRPAQIRHHQQQQQAEGGRGAVRGEELEEEAEEKEEPDRLAALLQQSRFECSKRPTGYYADEELACEVFHYCQEGVKHSWICPDGFTFHQVHLICMPPTQDNICQQSAKYTFVNEYLYRPVNSEEVARKPSTPLRYSERYYPEEVYHDERRALDDEEVEDRPRQTSPAPARLVAAGGGAGAGGPVFHSAEEVNIPLGQRRPQQHRPYDFHF